MRSNFAPRLGVRRESVFDVLERHGRRGRLVGIAHLLDPFGEDVVRSVTSVQPTGEIDHSLTAEARRVVDDEDPDLLVLQLLAADQLGHVRGVAQPRVPRPARRHRPARGGVPRLPRRARQARRRDGDPDGRPRPGPRHRRPRPPRLGRAAGAVRGLGRGRGAGRGRRASRARCWSWRPTISRCWGCRRRPRRAAARWCPADGGGDVSAAGALPGDRGGARRGGGRRCRARRASRARRAGSPSTCCSSTTARATARRGSARERGARVVSHAVSRGLGAALRTGLERRPRRGLRRRRLPRRGRRVRPRRLRARARARGARPRRLRARLALPRPPRGHEPGTARSPTATTSAAARLPDGDGH